MTLIQDLKKVFEDHGVKCSHSNHIGYSFEKLMTKGSGSLGEVTFTVYKERPVLNIYTDFPMASTTIDIETSEPADGVC